MEKKINVAEILRGREHKVELYDRVRNINVSYWGTASDGNGFFITCIYCDCIDTDVKYFKYSVYGTECGYPDGMVVLVPSKEMQDWDKFQTKDYKDGDILYVKGKTMSYVFIKKGNEQGENLTLYHVLMYKESGYVGIQNGKHPVCEEKTAMDSLRYATDDEEKSFFAALRREGWIWNAEKHELEFVGVLKGYNFKPFDKVLVRDSKDERWRPAFFSSFDEHCIHDYAYGLVGDPEGVFCKYCIPYNDQTAHLLGTTDDWKGGEE